MPGGEATLVFLAALATALATGLGALPLPAARVQGQQWLGVSDALASGSRSVRAAAARVRGCRARVRRRTVLIHY